MKNFKTGAADAAKATQPVIFTVFPRLDSFFFVFLDHFESILSIENGVVFDKVSGIRSIPKEKIVG